MHRMHNPAHPGEVLRDGWPEHTTITEAARALGVTRAALSRILNGKASISADMAFRLEAWLGIEAEMWLGMQMQFNLWKESQYQRPSVVRLVRNDGNLTNGVPDHRTVNKQSIIQCASVRVIGLGGCGGNAVDHMIASGLTGVDFICADTDTRALERCKAKTLLRLGRNVTKGLGAGGNPDIGCAAAEEDRERIVETIDGADILFIIAGMGGGTGTGAAPIVAEVAKELGILTVAVVTEPFAFEGKRARVAVRGMDMLPKFVDSAIVVPNDKLMQILGENVSFQDAFKAANDMLYSVVSGIAAVINGPGLVNVDFIDVKTIMSDNGVAMIGSGWASGADRAKLAAERAVNSPLLEDVDLAGARGVLVNITASTSLKMKEYYDVMESIKEFTAKDATVIVGTVIDDNIGDTLRVIIVATGINARDRQILDASAA